MTALTDGVLAEYLPSQREMSVQTSDTYAYAFQLLVCFAAERLKTTPSALSIEQLDATLVLAFLRHVVHDEQAAGLQIENRRRNVAARRIEPVVADESRHVDLAVVHLPPHLTPAHTDSQLGKPHGRRSCIDKSRRIRNTSAFIVLEDPVARLKQRELRHISVSHAAQAPNLPFHRTTDHEDGWQFATLGRSERLKQSWRPS